MSHPLPVITIDPSCYTSKAVFRTEIDRIFARSWQYVGHVSKVRSPGDYFVAEVAGESLIVTRSSDHQLNALYNVCAHRASRVARGEGRKNRFTCPNHGWCYDNRGRLLNANNAENVPGFDLANYALKTCVIEELSGLLFVNLDDSAESLQTSAKGMVDEIKQALPQLPDYQFAHRTQVTMKANWKVAVENFSECYHCPLVHQGFFSDEGTAEGGGVDASSYRIETRGIWHRHQGDVYSPADGKDDTGERESFYVWWLWPNFAVQKHPGNMVNVRQWVPLKTGETLVYVDWFLPGPCSSAERKIIEEHASGVFAEDVPIIEMVHQGLKSRGYDGGPLMIDTDGSVLSEHAVAAIQDLWRASMA